MESTLFWTGVLSWYQQYGRSFPWRHTSDPFHILVAEFLLQQTNVRKVSDVFGRLVSEYPDPRSLADANLVDLRDIVRPIGLIYRAERLKKCCEIICAKHDGMVPDSPKDLRALPGVGQYISNAVLCYAFGKDTVPVDVNVIRVFARYYGMISTRSRPHTDSALQESIARLYPPNDRRECNLAVLDLSALICRANRPKCKECPVAGGCQAAQTGSMDYSSVRES